MYKFAVLAALVATSAAAQSADDRRLSLTIYNNDLALVQDERSIDVPAGRTKVEFKDVSAHIRPETVALSSRGISIAEQNFDYDLLTPEKLMEKAVGQQVQIVRTNPGNGQQVTETATVLSANAGVVLKIGDRIEVLRDDGVPTRVIFPKVPDNLRPRPTLSITLDSDSAGPRKATLSYLTTGLSWNADYVALFDEKAGRLDLQGWITLKNSSGTSFSDADAQLVAGKVNLSGGDANPDEEEASYRDTDTGGGAEAGAAPPVGDYYLYKLPGRTTVADNQTKQVGFIDAKGVNGRKAYQYRAWGFQSLAEPAHASVVIDFANSAQGGLGQPLPAGIVRVYVRDAEGQPKFIGEDNIGHTPQGSELSVKTGDAFDVTIQPTVTAEEKAGKTRTRYSMSYLVRNARSQPVTVEIRQSGLWRDGKVLAESQKSQRLDASTLLWPVQVPAGGETNLTFTVDTGW